VQLNVNYFLKSPCNFFPKILNLCYSVPCLLEPWLEQTVEYCHYSRIMWATSTEDGRRAWTLCGFHSRTSMCFWHSLFRSISLNRDWIMCYIYKHPTAECFRWPQPDDTIKHYRQNQEICISASYGRIRLEERVPPLVRVATRVARCGVADTPWQYVI